MWLSQPKSCFANKSPESNEPKYSRGIIWSKCREPFCTLRFVCRLEQTEVKWVEWTLTLLAELWNDVSVYCCFALQATYAYMKAAYLSMLTPDDRLTFGESEISLFRWAHHPAVIHHVYSTFTKNTRLLSGVTHTSCSLVFLLGVENPPSEIYTLYSP